MLWSMWQRLQFCRMMGAMSLPKLTGAAGGAGVAARGGWTIVVTMPGLPGWPGVPTRDGEIPGAEGVETRVDENVGWSGGLAVGVWGEVGAGPPQAASATAPARMRQRGRLRARLALDIS